MKPWLLYSRQKSFCLVASSDKNRFWCKCPSSSPSNLSSCSNTSNMVFLSISFNLNALRLQVLTGKESNFPFIINAAKSEMMQGKCLQFWLLINVAKLCFGLKSIQTALLSWAFDFFGYYKVSEYIKLNEFEPCYQLWTWKTFLIESLSFILASHFFFVWVLINKA